MIPENVQFSSNRLRSGSSNPSETAPQKFQLEFEPEGEREPLLNFKASQLKIAEQNNNLEFSKFSLKDSSIVLSNEDVIDKLLMRKKNLTVKRKSSVNDLSANLDNYLVAQSNGKQKVISVKKRKSLQNVNSTHLRHLKAPIADHKSSEIYSTDKLNTMKKFMPGAQRLEIIENLLSAEIKKSGPFDLEGKRIYSSPYNKSLLNILEKNLKSLMPKELDDYEFSDYFIEIIKQNVWKEELGIFAIDEHSIQNLINLLDFENNTNIRRYGWVKYSSKGLKTNTGRVAQKNFSFRIVFNKFITFENLSRFFFTDNICQESITFFKLLDSRLLKLVAGSEKNRRRSVDAILNQIWLGLTGFLAHVHAINAIIAPSKILKPLSNEELVAKQEEAFIFFCDLHKDIEKYSFQPRTRESTRVISTFSTVGLSFEQIRDLSIYQLVNARFSRNHVAWIYIELWLFKYKPELQKINNRSSEESHLTKRSKFISLVNRMCFIFFSGMAKNEKLEQENSTVTVLKI
ncbi:hypothetical protein BY996DRAFT_2878935 [Phakopsora pachyrhizi]|uniref:Uncharacterized protein n=1 Tax=Phakopsora pachyrhizi TaxID=170000 RepID=A0AAV0AIP8_PHAPC|nr:hypothetical protein BY996DRAFT_2878935 [Phakopsora pachyrhizi]CAH7668305.1 hypothetical protein PPACK8108_LOCUS2791 [Phakopsora pachyrhizi]